MDCVLLLHECMWLNDQVFLPELQFYGAIWYKSLQKLHHVIEYKSQYIILMSYSAHSPFFFFFSTEVKRIIAYLHILWNNVYICLQYGSIHHVNMYCRYTRQGLSTLSSLLWVPLMYLYVLNLIRSQLSYQGKLKNTNIIRSLKNNESYRVFGIVYGNPLTVTIVVIYFNCQLEKFYNH